MFSSAPPHGSAATPKLPGWRRARGARARVGVQVDDRRLAVVRVRAAMGDRPILEHVETVVSADSGVRAAALRRLAQAGLMRDAEVSLALSAGQYELHAINTPPVPEDELRDAVRWQLRGVLAYAPEEAAVDFSRLPQPADAATSQAGRPQLLAVAARLVTVDAGVRALAECGVTVTSVDIPEFAQRNLSLLHAAPEGCVAWLSFEADACLLTVQLGGELCFARRFQAQGASLLVAGAGGGAGSDAAGGEADSVTQYFIERVVVHTQRSLELFERQSGLPAVSQMWIAPHLCATQLAGTIVERTGVDTRVFAVAEAFEPGAAFLASTSAAQSNPDWLVAAGAALREAEAPVLRLPTSLRSLLGPLFAPWFARPQAPARLAVQASRAGQVARAGQGSH